MKERFDRSKPTINIGTIGEDMDTKEETKNPEDYTIRKVNLNTGEKETVKKALPKGHLEIIKKQMKAQANALHKKYVDDKDKKKRRAKSKSARKSRKRK